MNEMNKQFSCFATWEPGTPLKIGDIGELHHNEFTYVSSLKEKGMDFNVRVDDSAGDLKYASGRSVKISTKASGQVALPQFNLDVGDAGIVVQFSAEKAVVFEASGVEHRMITQVDQLDRYIEREKEADRWQDEWAIISDLMVAKSATVLISQGRDANIALRAKANVPNLSLSNVEAQFETAVKNQMNTTIVCQAGLTPLFKVRGIVRKFGGLGGTKAGAIRDGPVFIKKEVHASAAHR